MNEIQREIDVALNRLENRNLRQASGAQINVMGGLNQAVLSLQNSQKQIWDGLRMYLSAENAKLRQKHQT